MQTVFWNLLNISDKYHKKSILIISSYTVSNLLHFFWDTVYVPQMTDRQMDGYGHQSDPTPTVSCDIRQVLSLVPDMWRCDLFLLPELKIHVNQWPNITQNSATISTSKDCKKTQDVKTSSDQHTLPLDSAHYSQLEFQLKLVTANFQT